MEKILNLAIKIQKEFSQFYLAGGTAIMLKHNHRESIDLDFFRYTHFSFRYPSYKMRKLFKIQKEEVKE